MKDTIACGETPPVSSQRCSRDAAVHIVVLRNSVQTELAEFKKKKMPMNQIKDLCLDSSLFHLESFMDNDRKTLKI